MENMLVIALGARGEGMSGGDRLFIEFCRRWSKTHKITMLVNEEGREMCRRNNLENVEYLVINLSLIRKLGFWPHYLANIIAGIIYSFKIKGDIVYSASDFWMDLIPSSIIKKRSKSKLIGGFYLVAPKHNIPYVVSQMLSKFMLRYSNAILVTNDSIKEELLKYVNKPIFVTKGGIDNDVVDLVPNQKKIFDGVFIGRLHEQKGVLQLIDIWHNICSKRPQAGLAIIGTGSMEEKMKEKVKNYGMETNVKFCGFLDGKEKIKVFKQSKIVLHTEVYGIGSMAPMEAMACGLPCVCFNLPDFKNYYTKGVLFSSNNVEFAENIIKLLNNKEMYAKIGKDAKELAKNYDWEILSKKALEFIKS